jgi:hypothetical protein
MRRPRGNDQVAALPDYSGDVGFITRRGVRLDRSDVDAELVLCALDALPGQCVEGVVVEAVRIGDEADCHAGPRLHRFSRHRRRYGSRLRRRA